MSDNLGTISQFAKAENVAQSTIRKWIKKGFFKVDNRVKPMLILSGTRPVSRTAWTQAITDACQPLRKGTWGMGSDPQHVSWLGLDGVERRQEYSASPALLDAVLRDIKRAVVKS